MGRFVVVLMLLLLSQPVLAQVEMADTMRESGKIYVVVLVMSIIFAGIVFYLIRIERKLKKLEENNKS